LMNVLELGKTFLLGLEGETRRQYSNQVVR
jgi:hypothetical protein